MTPEVIARAFDGPQLADAARSIRPALKILSITGYAENAVLNHGHLEPGMQILTKPLPIMALTGRIRDLLGPTCVPQPPETATCASC